MFCAMSDDPAAASETLRPISPVVAVCSSTAEAMVAEYPLIFSMMPAICRMTSMASPVSLWIAWMEMSPVAFAVAWARSLTSLATTAKPLPASPARTASMVALSAAPVAGAPPWRGIIPPLIPGWSSSPVNTIQYGWSPHCWNAQPNTCS
jgi:hypothetical protein